MDAKILRGTIPIFVLLFACMSSCLFISCSSEEAIYILPDKFIGKVAIIYNDPDAEELPYQNKHRIFEIPDNGILKTKSAYRGVDKYRSKFYFRKANGTLEIVQLSGGIALCGECQVIKEPNSISIIKDDCRLTQLQGANKKNEVESFIVEYNPAKK